MLAMKKLQLTGLLVLLWTALFITPYTLLAQTGKKITGKVTNETGEPLAGVTVEVKGIKGATTTAIDGIFSITLQGNETTLVFSYVGYAKQEVAFKNKSSLEVIMAPEKNELPYRFCSFCKSGRPESGTSNQF
jgi:TonB-dependent starch-binding outer membrane protein SusC